MMPLSSHLRLEVLQESMEDVNLRRDILFILLPAVFQATRSTSDSTGSKVARSVPRWSHTRVDHAARRISAKLSLSLAFIVFWPLSHRISLNRPIPSKSILVHPHHLHTGSLSIIRHLTPSPQCVDGGGGGYCPRVLQTFTVDYHQLIFYIYPNGL